MTERNVLSKMRHFFKEFTGIAQYTSVPKSELTQMFVTLRTLVGKNKAAMNDARELARDMVQAIQGPGKLK
jgi:hypothetical protein